MSCPPAGPPPDLLFLDGIVYPFECLPHRPVYAVVGNDLTFALVWDGTAFVPDTPDARLSGAIEVPACPPGGGRFGPVPVPATLPPGRYAAVFHQTPPSHPAGTPGPKVGYQRELVVTGGVAGRLVPGHDLASQIARAAAGPASATSADGRSAAAHPLPDLIAVDEYLSKKRAAGRSPWSVLRRTTALPPGAI